MPQSTTAAATHSMLGQGGVMSAFQPVNSSANSNNMATGNDGGKVEQVALPNELLI